MERAVMERPRMVRQARQRRSDGRRLRGRRAARGLTLVEVLVTTAILGLLFAGITAALLFNQKQVGVLSETAANQSALRTGLAQIENAVARAGFGMDPAYAVDTAYRNDAGGLVRMRDGVGPFGSDELLVHFRDPTFESDVLLGNPAALTLAPRLLGSRMPTAGDRLLLLCASGLSDPLASAYVTVQSAAAAGPNWTVTIDAGAAWPFNQQADIAASPCLGNAGSRAYRIERRHFFVDWLYAGDSVPPRPALMMSTGLDLDGDGTPGVLPDQYVPGGARSVANGAGSRVMNDAQLLVLDVEQLQVAYVMNEPPAAAAALGLGAPADADGNWVFGDVGGLEVPRFELVPAGALPFPLLDAPRLECLQAAAVDPLNGCAYGTRRRFTGHPGNIRRIRISLVARGARPDPSIPETQLVLNRPEDGEGPLENLGVDLLPPASRHRRHRVQTTVSLKNMQPQKHFIQGGELTAAGGVP